MQKKGLETTKCRLAAVSLNQWAMDFEGNKKRIIESIEQAKELGCTYRLGPELDITGYSCEDHFLELDTVNHSWEVVADILEKDYTQNIICELGMPVQHKGALYNCRIILFNKKVVLVRPKMFMAENGNYRESRFFTPWAKTAMEELSLPQCIQRVTGQKNCPIGVAIIQTNDTEIGVEICEELWTPKSPHIDLCLDGCEIITNASGSYFELFKVFLRMDLLKSASGKSGCCYLYTNQLGVDGQRTYFDGGSMIAVNGNLIAYGERFAPKDVDVVTAVIDLEEIRERKLSSKSRSNQSSVITNLYTRIKLDFNLCQWEGPVSERVSDEVYKQSKAEEIAYSTAAYLWQYIKRSGASGFFLPLSGGADSAASALIVYTMSCLVYDHIKNEEDDGSNLEALRRIFRKKDPNWSYPTSPEEITSRILYTGYLGSENSSKATKERAAMLSKQIGSTHFEISISDIYKSFNNAVHGVFKQPARFAVHGGSLNEDLALQNLQARTRMVMSYFLAQLIPGEYQLPSYVLVLGSANLDESLVGYFTKYDCSSADINPIGGISKTDLKEFLVWGEKHLKLTALGEILNAPPTAELRPLDESTGNFTQTDEADIGMTYKELSIFGRLRKVMKAGPVSMFRKLSNDWKEKGLKEIASQIKLFFKKNSINRHKMTTLTPAVHCEGYSVDDNRFDLRPFLYNNNWTYQFKKLDEIVAQTLEVESLLKENLKLDKKESSHVSILKLKPEDKEKEKEHHPVDGFSDIQEVRNHVNT